MSIPRFEIKEKSKSNMLICVAFCILVPLLLAAIIYEIRALVIKCKPKRLMEHCEGGGCLDAGIDEE